MKVLIADAFEKSGLEALQAAGLDVVHQPDLKDAALAEAIRETGAEVLVVRSTKVTEAMLDAGRLALVVRAGAGYNTIDVKAASARGIYVSNCPGKNAIAVAELTFALILALDRRIADNVADLRTGVWNKKHYSKAAGLAGRTLGILGAGSIAREVIRRAAAFGMPVVLWSRRFDGRTGDLTAEEREALGVEGDPAGVRLAATPLEVAAQSDVLSVHLALNPETQRLVGAGDPRAAEAGRDADQHLARRAGRSRGAGRRGAHARPSRGPRRLRRGARDGDRRVQGSAGRAWPASTARTTSAPRPTRRRRRSPPRPCASCAPSPRRAGCRTSSTSPAARRPRTCSSCATRIVRACSPTSSSTCAPAT